MAETVNGYLKVSIQEQTATVNIGSVSINQTTPGANSVSVSQLPVSLGTNTSANSLPVTLSNDGTFAAATGAVADSAATDSTSSWSVIALLKGILSKLITPTATGHVASATITRPNDTIAYAQKDAIGNTNGSAILTFSNMGKAGGEIILISLTFELDVASSAIGATTLYLYNAAPTAIADNAAWDFVSGDRGKYIDKIQIGTPIDEGSTLLASVDSINKQISLVTSSLYGILTTDTSFTPAASTVKKIILHSTDI